MEHYQNNQENASEFKYIESLIENLEKLNVSQETIKAMRRKYEIVQKYPDFFHPRTFSSIEVGIEKIKDLPEEDRMMLGFPDNFEEFPSLTFKSLLRLMNPEQIRVFTENLKQEKALAREGKPGKENIIKVGDPGSCRPAGGVEGVIQFITQELPNNRTLTIFQKARIDIDCYVVLRVKSILVKLEGSYPTILVEDESLKIIPF